MLVQHKSYRVMKATQETEQTNVHTNHGYVKTALLETKDNLNPKVRIGCIVYIRTKDIHFGGDGNQGEDRKNSKLDGQQDKYGH